jgi:hypothetical protein
MNSRMACLHHARDHALFDDRVAARAQAGAQEQLRDVLAAAASTVDEIGRAAVTRDRALERHLAVAGVRAADLAIAVVEHQLDRGGTDRLACAGAVEHYVAHRLAAQVARRQLAHHPAYRIDDVGLAATVRTHHTDQVARQVHRRRIHKRLEAGEPDFVEPH